MDQLFDHHTALVRSHCIIGSNQSISSFITGTISTDYVNRHFKAFQSCTHIYSSHLTLVRTRKQRRRILRRIQQKMGGKCLSNRLMVVMDPKAKRHVKHNQTFRHRSFVRLWFPKKERNNEEIVSEEAYVHNR